MKKAIVLDLLRRKEGGDNDRDRQSDRLAEPQHPGFISGSEEDGSCRRVVEE